MTALCSWALLMGSAEANPAGGSVTHGNATIDRNGNILTINQGSDRLIMGWQSFSIGQGETTRFVQPSSSSMALNRVNGGTRSMIEGRLEANGGVILINPAGITVTKSGVVNVNTFIGSTRDITDDEFLKGSALNFKGTSDASVENLGTIHAETGDVVLIAHTVRNEGTLSAPKGVVGIAAGDEVLYQPNSDERLMVKSQTAQSGTINHSGTIQAAAAEIKSAGNPYAVAINLDGIVEARGNVARNIRPRVIVHAAQGDIHVGSPATFSASDETGGGLVKIQAANGNFQLDGKVVAKSQHGMGGEIQILGNAITVSGTALLDASGATGGGRIFVGGDYQGGANPTNRNASAPLQNASTLRIDKGAVMNADATVQGNGGVIINWADGTTVSSGAVSVRGGPLGGNGGFVEISGKQNLGFDGAVQVGAEKGTPGTVLFDPAQIQITSATDLSVYSEPAITVTGTNQISYTDYSEPSVWVMSQNFFTDFTSGTIILQAYNISLEDPKGNNRAKIVLNPDVHLELHSMAGGTDPKIYLPGANDGGDGSRSSITASGSGSVKLDASSGSQLIIHGDITTAAGDIMLLSQYNIALAGSTIQTTSGNITVASSGGKIDFFSTVSPATVPTLARGTSILTGSGTVTISAPGQIYLGGSTVISGTGNINLTSTSGIIKLFSDYYFPDGTNGALIPSAIQSAGGAIILNGATGIILDGATIANTAGSIQISSINGGVVLDVAPYQKDTASAYGSAFAGTTISAGSGSMSISAKTDLSLTEATLVSTNGGSISLISPTSYLQLYNSQIETTSGDITISSFYNEIHDSTTIRSDKGKVNIGSSYFTRIWGPNGEIKSSALGDAIVISSGTYFLNYAGSNALQAPNGRWIVYNQNPANIANYFGGLNSGNNAIWNTKAGTPLTVDKTGNRYVFATAPSGQITLLNTSKVYGQNWTPIFGRDYTITAPNSSGAFTISSSDLDFSGVTVSLSSLGYDAKATVGSYLVNFVSSANENITLAPGSSASLTVTPAMLTVGLTNVSKTYDGTTVAVLGSNNFGLSGLVNGDTVTLLNTPSTGVYASSGAGSGIVVTASASKGFSLSGSAATNYILSTNGFSGYGTITPASLTASLTGSVSKVYDGTTGATLSAANYLLSGILGTDKVALNNPISGTYESANAGAGKSVSVTGLALDNANYQLGSTTINGSIGTILPAPTPEPTTSPLLTSATIVAEPTVQTAVSSLTIRNTTTTTSSSGGAFGSSGPGSEGSGSGGESASAAEAASSGESSSSATGAETASSESSSSESSTASTDSGSSAGATSSDSSSSSGSSSTASSSSGSASGGTTASSSGNASQGAKAQAAAISRMNNPVAGAAVGGAEFQRLNPFSDAGGMHEEVAAVSGPPAGGNAHASSGRAAAVSVKSPEMAELAPMNDLNVLFMMF